MLSLHPFSGARIGLTVTNLLSDVKGEWFTDSASEAMQKAADLVSWPDTLVWVHDTDSNGNKLPVANAVISRDGYKTLA